MVFSQTGSKKRDFWLIDGQKDWAIIPNGTINGFNQDLPVRLQVGDLSWGQKHIDNKHRHWLEKLNKSLADTLYLKLGQSGQIYSTEDDCKIKIMMYINPGALLVLRHVQDDKDGDFFTVVTLYKQNKRLDGESLGRYLYTFRVDS